jgi:hypothetical protein
MLGVMVTEAGRFALTFIITELDVAGLPIEQLMDEVKTQVTISPLLGLYEKEELLVPEITPFTFH